MTHRPKQHQLEDRSRAKYNLVLPRNWVIRDKDKDYGIDAEVEIFDENGRATGLVYWVQLKATETSDTLAARKVDFSIDRIKYYKSLELPVLIVRYSEKEDQFYCKWAHEIDLFYTKQDAKTTRITFTDKDIWDADSPVKTIKYINKIRLIKSGAITLPVPTLLYVNDTAINGLPRAVFMSAYRDALQSYSHLAIYQSDSDKAVLCANIKDDELFISLASASMCTFHNIINKVSDNLAEEIVIAVLMGLAVTMADIGQSEMSSRIFLDSKIKDSFFKNEFLLNKFVPMIVNTSRYSEIIDSVCEVIDTKEDNILESITTMSALAVMDSNDQEKCSKFQKLLDKCLAKYVTLGESPLIGVSHYNLGNHYRSRNLYRKSIIHYLMARKFESKYLNQPYYYQELGGALFEYGKYRFSAKLYKLALDKGASESTKVRYADALMLGGYYRLAHEVFTEHLNSVEDEDPVWHLKNMCLEYLIDKTGIEEQVRQKKDALNKIDTSKVGDSSFKHGLDMAIELDNLCGLAWFNLGIVHSDSGKYEEAAFNFILCGLVQTWDIEAWVNAALVCFNEETLIENLPDVLSAAYFFNGEKFLSAIYKELEVRFDGDSDNLDKTLILIDELLPDSGKQKELPTIRIMHEDGLFRDIIHDQ